MSLALIWGIVNSYRSNMTEDIITNLKEIDRKKCQKLQNLTFYEKSYFQVFNYISGDICPTGEYYTLN